MRKRFRVLSSPYGVEPSHLDIIDDVRHLGPVLPHVSRAQVSLQVEATPPMLDEVELCVWTTHYTNQM